MSDGKNKEKKKHPPVLTVRNRKMFALHGPYFQRYTKSRPSVNFNHFFTKERILNLCSSFNLYSNWDYDNDD